MVCKAFAPAHITGFFYIDDMAEDVLKSGSLGAGFCIDDGVECSIYEADKEEIFINGIRRDDAIVSKRVLELFFQKSGLEYRNFCVKHFVGVPQGGGFGTSGAGALSLAYALNSFYEDVLDYKEVASIAHIAEVECKTGLGTVNGQFLGGFEIRFEAGAPILDGAKSFVFDDDLEALFCSFGALSTRDNLREPETRRLINSLGLNFTDELMKGFSVEKFLSLSNEFSKGVNLLSDEAKSIIDFWAKDNQTGAMLMFGDGIFTIGKDEKISYIYNRTKERFNGNIFVSPIRYSGACVL